MKELEYRSDIVKPSDVGNSSVLLDFATAQYGVSESIHLPFNEFTEPLDPSATDFLACLVLHDSLLVDSLLLERESYGKELLKLGTIRGLYIPLNARGQLAEVSLSHDAYASSLGESMPRDFWDVVQLVDRPEHNVYAGRSQRRYYGETTEYRPISMKPQGDRNLFVPDHEDVASEFNWIEHRLRNPIDRVKFYLEISSRFGIPIQLCPVKNKIIDDQVHLLIPIIQEQAKKCGGISGPAKVMKYLTSLAVSESLDELDHLFSTEVTIPSVTRQVLAIAKRDSISPYDAAITLRDTNNAQQFRKWVGELVNACSDDLANLNLAKKLKDQLRLVCKTWMSDVDEQAKYITRKVTIKHIPAIGKLLESVGISEMIIRDPILVPRKNFGQLIFLNDVIRSNQ